MEDIGGEVGPAPEGVTPQVPDEGKLCAMAGENDVGSQAGAAKSATSIASVAGLGVLQGTLALDGDKVVINESC